MVARPQLVAQMSMDEQIINDPEMEAALEERAENAAAAKNYRDAMREIKARLPLEEGLYRCGGWTLLIKERVGGGFTVREWKRNVARISAAGAE